MKRDYSCSITMSDLLFNMLLAFVAMFTLAFAQMNAKKVNNNAEIKAEFMITFSWPNELDDDVDAYVEDPTGHLICFRRREDGLMHLDRDDLGHRNDTINTAFGLVKYEGNREVITVRGCVPGEYVVNVHMYRRNGLKTDCPVTVQVDQLNPYAIVALKTVILQKDGDEKTVFRFNMQKNGEKYVISPKIYDEFKSLANAQSGNPEPAYSEYQEQQTADQVEGGTP